jgi:NADPH-dependent glutamate synthase beta subunit-like oxidoreductase/Pyruvate/2-oxoacid:ferredoxin oxidoreductase delta subunit
MIELNPRTLADVPLVSESDHSTTALRTGTWKYVQPAYRDALPVCAFHCPAGNDISHALALLADGAVDEAAAWWRAGNPLPATLGRVCPQPCEAACNRGELGGAIAVHRIERFLGDHSLSAAFVPEPGRPTGRRVAVVGSGPAGIAAAYHLALAGHGVVVYDDKPQPGGYLRTGIPEYRLPREVLDGELALVAGLGVEFRCGIRIGRDLAFDELRARHDAVIVAVGFHGSNPLGVPGEDHPLVFNGVRLLERLLAGERPGLPQRLAVVGGGNTAMDVARSLWRVGVKPVVVYRRTRAEMPAIAAEVDEAEVEGIEIQYLTAPVAVVAEGERVTALRCERMRLGEPDASGRRRPERIEGTAFDLVVDGVVTAIGESAELEFLPEALRDGWRIAADGVLATALPGVFAAGDAESGAGTVTAAVGAGRRVAAVVDAYLREDVLEDAARPVRYQWPRTLDRERVIGAEELNRTYFLSEHRPAARELAPRARAGGFAEVVQGITVVEAVAEARRCLACGTCNRCRNCIDFCPDVAIRELPGGGFEIDYDHCKGCGICVEECPRGAMVLEEVAR